MLIMKVLWGTKNMKTSSWRGDGLEYLVLNAMQWVLWWNYPCSWFKNV